MGISDSDESAAFPRKSPSQTHFESIVVIQTNLDEFEIHCHGGKAAVERILHDMRASGIQVVDALGSWQQESEMLIAEAEKVLIRCSTPRTAAIALDQVRGSLYRWCMQVLEGGLELRDVQLQAARMLSFAEIGLHLCDGFQVVFAGEPNVGKSSLINSIVGYDRSITMNEPGTTRDVLRATTTIQGIPIHLSDTAGIRDSHDSIEKEGIRRANQAVQDADLVVWVHEPPVRDRDLAHKKSAEIHVLNKADKLDHDPPSGWVCTIATDNRGVQELMNQIVSTLVPQFPNPGEPLPINDRQFKRIRSLTRASDMQQCQRIVADLAGH